MHKDSPTKTGEGADGDDAAGKCSEADPSGDEDWCTPPSTKYKRHGAPGPVLPETRHVADVQIWGPLERRRPGGWEVQVGRVVLDEMGP